jgi:hypothetical protein
MRVWSLTLMLLLLPACRRAPVPTRTTLEVVPPTTTVHGKTYGEWSAVWWKFLYSTPSSDNPYIRDDKCAEGQSGPVWFLFPKRGASPLVITRFCAVFCGKYVFFAVLSGTSDNVGRAVPMTVDELRADARKVIAPYTPKCWLDGNELQGVTLDSPYRVVSPVFNFRAPAGNVLQYPAGLLVDPVVGDGVWIMLEPLAAGHHIIRFSSSSLAAASVYDFTYNLDIVPAEK